MSFNVMYTDVWCERATDLQVFGDISLKEQGLSVEMCPIFLNLVFELFPGNAYGTVSLYYVIMCFTKTIKNKLVDEVGRCFRFRSSKLRTLVHSH